MPSILFSPLTLRDITFRNRVFVSPMCQYSSDEGMPSAWHLVHLGSRAVGGAACVIQEASAVLPEGRITPSDAGIWNDEQASAYAPIAQFIKSQGAVPAIQLAHAGRKASVSAPWDGNKSLGAEEGGWPIRAPSAVAFDEHSTCPKSMDEKEISNLVEAFVKASERSLKAGFDIVEIHAAHGYLLHEFLSPLSNQRQDLYGGSLENRMRLPLKVVAAVRAFWPQTLPIFVRISASDWVEGGWDIKQSVIFSAKCKELGVDLIDASSGGLVPYAKIPAIANYQVPFAQAIKEQAKIATGAVGMITEAEQAEQIIERGEADVVLLARELLRDPYWPLHAAHKLGEECVWPKQYERAKLRRQK